MLEAEFQTFFEMAPLSEGRCLCSHRAKEKNLPRGVQKRLGEERHGLDTDFSEQANGPDSESVRAGLWWKKEKMIDGTSCLIVSESEHTDVVSTAAVDRVKLEETKPLLSRKGVRVAGWGEGGWQVVNPLLVSV